MHPKDISREIAPIRFIWTFAAEGAFGKDKGKGRRISKWLYLELAGDTAIISKFFVEVASPAFSSPAANIKADIALNNYMSRDIATHTYLVLWVLGIHPAGGRS
jgi:hypothetical protein